MPKAKQGYQRGLGKAAAEVKINNAPQKAEKPRELDWSKLENKNKRDSGASYRDAWKGK
jgi:hypothetical protein